MLQTRLLRIIFACLYGVTVAVAVDNPRQLYQHALAAIGQEDWQGAESLLAQVREHWPEHPQIHFLSGVTAFHAGRYQHAHYYFNQAGSVKEHLRPRLGYYRSLTLFRLGQNQQAYVMVQKMLTQHPEAPETAMLLGDKRVAAMQSHSKREGQEGGWEFAFDLSLSWDDNPAQIDDDLRAVEAPDADISLLAYAGIRFLGQQRLQRYRFAVLTRQYETVTELTAYEIHQDVDLFSSRSANRSFYARLQSRLHYLDKEIALHGESLDFTYGASLSGQWWLYHTLDFGIEDFRQSQNDVLDGRFGQVESRLVRFGKRPWLRYLSVGVRARAKDAAIRRHDRKMLELACRSQHQFGSWSWRNDFAVAERWYDQQVGVSGARRTDRELSLQLQIGYTERESSSTYYGEIEYNRRDSSFADLDYSRLRLGLGWRVSF